MELSDWATDFEYQQRRESPLARWIPLAQQVGRDIHRVVPRQICPPRSDSVVGCPRRDEPIQSSVHPVKNMKVRRLLLPVALITAASGSLMFGGAAHAQDPNPPRPNPPAERFSLFPEAEQEHPSESDAERYRRTAREMRTARAIYRANQRVARLERNLWVGYEPLRPRWNAIPSMTTRYTNPKFYVPVYVYNR